MCLSPIERGAAFLWLDQHCSFLSFSICSSFYNYGNRTNCINFIGVFCPLYFCYQKTCNWYQIPVSVSGTRICYQFLLSMTDGQSSHRYTASAFHAARSKNGALNLYRQDTHFSSSSYVMSSTDSSCHFDESFCVQSSSVPVGLECHQLDHVFCEQL